MPYFKNYKKRIPVFTIGLKTIAIMQMKSSAATAIRKVLCQPEWTQAKVSIQEVEATGKIPVQVLSTDS